MKRVLFWIIIGLVAVTSAALVFGIGPFGRIGGRAQQVGKLKVTASFYPMAEFARQVGGDLVDVTTLISPGVEPHDYDPTPRDIAGIYESKVLVYNGAALEPWADKIRSDLESSGVVVVNASDGISLITGDQTGTQGASGSSAYYDPHVWLDPVLAQQQVDNIKEGLIKADPANADAYERNAQAYKQQLAALDADYRNGLASCNRRDIVTSHQAFGYLAARYNLDVMSISGLSPDEEPSPQKLAEVAAFARDHNIQYIFFETLVSPSLAQTIANEVGAQTLVFNPLEGLTQDQIDQGEDYLSVMRENLANLRTAMDCK